MTEETKNQQEDIFGDENPEEEEENFEEEEKDITPEKKGEIPPKEEFSDRERQLFKRLLKEKERRKKLEEELKKLSPAEGGLRGSFSSRGESTDDIDEILRLQSEGYSAEEIRTLRSYSRRLNMPINRLFEDELIKAGLEALRSKKGVDQSALPPSGFVSPLPPAASKYESAKSKEEREAAFGEMMSDLMGGNKNLK